MGLRQRKQLKAIIDRMESEEGFLLVYPGEVVEEEIYKLRALDGDMILENCVTRKRDNIPNGYVLELGKELTGNFQKVGTRLGSTGILIAYVK